MSKLFDDASLAMIPSAYKDVKLYSIRPTDGSGDFTFSRGSNLAATRVDVNGLIEKGRENRLLQSNQLDTTWQIGGGGTGLTLTGGQADRNGGNTAWLIDELTNDQAIYQVVSTNGVQTFSMYAKAGTNDWVRLGLGGGAFSDAYFDLVNGTLGNTLNSIDSAIESAGNGWWRCSVSVNKSINAVYVYPSEANNSAGTNGSIYIQDAQLEAGLVATDYIETGASTAQAGILEDMPRLDYSGGASCPALLLEPQRTNKLIHSEYFGAGTGWGDNGAVTSDFGYLAPDGTYSATKFTNTGSGGSSGYVFYGGVLADDSRSVYARTTSGSGTANLMSYFGNTNNVFTITEEWQRFDLSSVTTTTGQGSFYLVDFRDGDLNEIILWGAQCEVGSYPTSYIPTYGSSVTRSKDTTNVEDFSSFLTGEDVTYMFELRSNESLVRDDSSGNLIFQYDGGLANSFRVYRASSNSIKTTIVWFDGNTANNPAAYVINSATPKVAIRRIYSTGEWDVFVDGVKVYSATNTNFLNFTRIQLQGAGTPQEFKQFVVFDTALTDSECIALTSI